MKLVPNLADLVIIFQAKKEDANVRENLLFINENKKDDIGDKEREEEKDNKEKGKDVL